ncbi:MAG: PKD domain-containing protein, partial [Gammaproteobacteria bacterium]|nr:PKD domain-containing protein [Gammaproteobacteria bacterium]
MVRRFLVVTVSVVVVLVSTALIAEPGNSPSSKKPRMLGKGNPFLLHDLPPGRVRSKIEGLPFQAWNRAMDWLHRFEFPENDLESMDVDNQGGVLYTDQAPVLPAGDGEPAPATEGEVSWQGAAAVDNAFLLHSRAGAPRVVYLDFNGHIFSGTAWSNGTISAAAFDLDEDPGTFNETERNFIAEIWHRVAEDFSAFDIDVTTEEPAVFDRHTGRILITSKTQTNGSEMPYSSYGGVAYIGVWGGSDYATYYSPALVYYDNLAKFPTYIAEASSHEFGHNLGLSHDGTGSTTYYGGHGSGATSWAPIMGNSYSRNVTQWSKGEYQGANNTQDDIGIIASELTMADDDHGDTMVQATPLTVDVNGQILVSNPELDPDNDYPDNKGKIESSTDQDMFYFQAAAGPIDLTVVPAWDAFYRDNKRGANLDIQASLLDESGAVLATSNPAAETDASISINVPGGNYYLVVTGVGSSNFSAYASTGQYFISGSISVTASNLPPIADFGVTCNDLNCAFVDYSSDPDGSITAWFWDFGDGATSSSPSPSHSFASAGSYPVSLRVTDNDDDTDIKIQSLTVTIDDIIPPVVTPPADITRE